jgi:hypothetical protein
MFFQNDGSLSWDYTLLFTEDTTLKYLNLLKKSKMGGCELDLIHYSPHIFICFYVLTEFARKYRYL